LFSSEAITLPRWKLPIALEMVAVVRAGRVDAPHNGIYTEIKWLMIYYSTAQYSKRLETYSWK
jgi:hypothetical protein